jgi:hypothetical protein
MSRFKNLCVCPTPDFVIAFWIMITIYTFLLNMNINIRVIFIIHSIVVQQKVE